MQQRHLGHSGISIAPLVLGGNVFGWTADEARSFELLDRFGASPLNAIDTADVYSAWVPGNRGGESESIIGRWLQKSRRRRDLVIITKVGSAVGPFKRDLKSAHILAAAEDSLRRLQTDYIDLYLSHWPDPGTPIEETLRAFEALIRQGKVRAIGASNYDATQLDDALTVAFERNLPAYTVLQPEYNLYSRSGFENGLRDICERHALGVITYYSLASGFLTGKYRSKQDVQHSARGRAVEAYLTERGMRILAALDEISRNREVAVSEVALAWVIAQPGVTAPIASATRIDQLDSLVRACELTLTGDELARLDTASR